MRQIKFNTTEPSSISLLHRYRAFAEPFLQQLAEATEAGCPINEESAKLAFKEQCKGSNLMMMWLQLRHQHHHHHHHQVRSELAAVGDLLVCPNGRRIAFGRLERRLLLNCGRELPVQQVRRDL